MSWQMSTAQKVRKDADGNRKECAFLGSYRKIWFTVSLSQTPKTPNPKKQGTLPESNMETQEGP